MQMVVGIGSMVDNNFSGPVKRMAVDIYTASAATEKKRRWSPMVYMT
jgi:hypothetical protein